MNPPAFDGVARTIATRLTRRTGLNLLAGASLPLIGLLADTGAKQKQVTLCLNGQTVRAPKKKAKKLLKKGATRGACSERCPSGQRLCGDECIPTGNCCDNTDCSGNDTCVNGACAPLRCGNGGPCFAFVTGTVSTGSGFQGLAWADLLCQEIASEGGLPGIYKAWLSDGSSTPVARFTNTANAGPYVRVGAPVNGGKPGVGPTVASSFAELLACLGGDCLTSPFFDTEPAPQVWTGTKSDGSAAADTCLGWTSNDGFGLVGDPTRTDEQWTDSGTGTCDGLRPLYCFQQAT